MTFEAYMEDIWAFPDKTDLALSRPVPSRYRVQLTIAESVSFDS